MESINYGAPNPDEILLLLERLCSLPYTEVQQRINEYIQSATMKKVCILVPLLAEYEEMVIHVIGDKILDRELRFPVAGNILYEAVKGKTAAVTNVSKLEDEIFRHILSVMPQYSMPSSILLIPIYHPKTNEIAVIICLVDDQTDCDLASPCVKFISELFRFCLGFLLNSLKCYEETRLKQQCQNLLAVSRKLITNLGDFSDLLREIMADVRKLTNAERCSLFLLDPEQEELVAKVFDSISTKESLNEMRIPIGQGIAGHVATTGKFLNIRNAYEHPLFYRGTDEITGFKTRNILCFPIRDESGIIGVAQLCNKIGGLYFDVFDEEIATAFSIYCGISIMHGIVYKKMQDAQARNKLSNEIMMYHMKVEEEIIQAVLDCKDNHNIKDFDKFHFSPRTIPSSHMPCYMIKMFDDLRLIKTHKLKIPTLVRFILYVKKGYRNAPYHNWFHAFSTAHFAYLLMKNLNLVAEDYMTDLQALVFLVSCVCHDIDHRGTNNAFQTKCSTVLASLYSSEGSVMERHHLAQSVCILNTEGCNIFGNFDSEKYSEALRLLRNNILATDLTMHFRNVKKQTEMVANYDKRDRKQQKLLFDMLMTCCDLSDQTKDWSVSQKTAEQIYDEFFFQGDLEKSMGSSPIEMMDRERASIPDLQVQFISNIVLPLFRNLSVLFPTLQPLVSVLEENRALWEISKTLFRNYAQQGIKGMDILRSSSFADEVLELYGRKHSWASQLKFT